MALGALSVIRCVSGRGVGELVRGGPASGGAEKRDRGEALRQGEVVPTCVTVLGLVAGHGDMHRLGEHVNTPAPTAAVEHGNTLQLGELGGTAAATGGNGATHRLGKLGCAPGATAGPGDADRLGKLG